MHDDNNMHSRLSWFIRFAIAGEQYKTALELLAGDAAAAKELTGRGDGLYKSGAAGSAERHRRVLRRLRGEADGGNRLCRKMSIHCRSMLRLRDGGPNIGRMESTLVCAKLEGGDEELYGAAEAAFKQRVTQKTEPWWAQADPATAWWFANSELDDAEQPLYRGGGSSFP